MRALIFAVLVFAATCAPARPGLAQIAVDVALVLAVDVSGSIDVDEAGLQREGYVAALRHPRLLQAVQDGIHGRIALAYVEWAGAAHASLVADWSIIEDARSAHQVADHLAEAHIGRGRRTSISGAIAAGLDLLDRLPYRAVRRVIDISGDGPNNDGVLVTAARDEAVRRGITVNGLPIINDRPNPFGLPQLADLDRYYIGCVIGGPGAFVVVAHDFEAFAEAILRKLILEIAMRPRPVPAPVLLHQVQFQAPSYAQGCDIGERLFRDRFRGSGGFSPY